MPTNKKVPFEKTEVILLWAWLNAGGDCMTRPSFKNVNARK